MNSDMFSCVQTDFDTDERTIRLAEYYFITWLSHSEISPNCLTWSWGYFLSLWSRRGRIKRKLTWWGFHSLDFFHSLVGWQICHPLLIRIKFCYERLAILWLKSALALEQVDCPRCEGDGIEATIMRLYDCGHYDGVDVPISHERLRGGRVWLLWMCRGEKDVVLCGTLVLHD